MSDETTPGQEYQLLMARLLRARESSLPEDELVDEMDGVWKRMSIAERRYANKLARELLGEQ